MVRVFTEHVRHFNSVDDRIKEVLVELEELLRRRMRKRGLLALPPRYLGYSQRSWIGVGAFDEIVQDCYYFALFQRMKALRKQLRKRDNIEGLITRNVDNFLLERQSENDRVGYAVFRNVRMAAHLGEKLGELVIEGLKEGRVRNASLLRLDPLKPHCPAVDPQDLQNHLEKGEGLEQGTSSLAVRSEEGRMWVLAFLRQLKNQGVGAVRVGDLVGVLATRARTSRLAPHAVPQSDGAYEGDDDLTELVSIVHPDLGVDERDRWEQLKAQVPRRIERLDRQERVRERLIRVFAGLVEMIDEGSASPPTQSELTERLGVARATLSDDFRILRGVLEELISDENPDV